MSYLEPLLGEHDDETVKAIATFVMVGIYFLALLGLDTAQGIGTYVNGLAAVTNDFFFHLSNKQIQILFFFPQYKHFLRTGNGYVWNRIQKDHPGSGKILALPCLSVFTL